MEKAIRCDTDNLFYQTKFDIMCKHLEACKTIWLYCWCTGHTRCAMVEGTYAFKLREKYGDRLVEGHSDCVDTFTLKGAK